MIVHYSVTIVVVVLGDTSLYLLVLVSFVRKGVPQVCSISGEVCNGSENPKSDSVASQSAIVPVTRWTADLQITATIASPLTSSAPVFRFWFYSLPVALLQ